MMRVFFFIILAVLGISFGDQWQLYAQPGNKVRVLFNNQTGYNINLYADNTFIGQLGPYATKVSFEIIDTGKKIKIYGQGTGGTQTWNRELLLDNSATPEFNITGDMIVSNNDGGKPIKDSGVRIGVTGLDELASLQWDTNKGGDDSAAASIKLYNFKARKEIRSGIVYAGDAFSVVIHSNKPEIRKYIYVVIYSTPANESSLVYPNKFTTRKPILFPRLDANGKPILNHRLVDITVSSPFGTDTYVLIGSGEPIKDLAIFNDFNEIMLLLKGSPLSKFHDILKGDYYVRTLEVQARPLIEKAGVLGNKLYNYVSVYSTDGNFSTGISTGSMYAFPDSSEIFYSPLAYDTLVREKFPIIDFIEPVLENVRGGKVLNNEAAKKVVFKGIAVDRVNGVRSVKINGEPPQTYRPGSGYFDYNYELDSGLNTVNVLVENNLGYMHNYRVSFSYEPEKKAVLPASKNYLFIIGINNYKYWGKLNNAVKDGMDFKSLMQSKFGYQKEQIVELYDSMAIMDNIIAKLGYFAKNLSPNDNLLIYYSGHGFYNPDIELGYWVPVNAENKKESGYLGNVLIARYLRGIKTKRIFLISDACYSGSLLDEGKRGEGPYLDKIKEFKARIVLASGRLEEVSDGIPGTNSPFASQLLNFLRTSAEKEILSSDIISFVKKAVGNNAKQIPTGGVLMDTGDEGGEFIFERK